MLQARLNLIESLEIQEKKVLMIVAIGWPYQLVSDNNIIPMVDQSLTKIQLGQDSKQKSK